MADDNNPPERDVKVLYILNLPNSAILVVTSILVCRSLSLMTKK